MVNGMKKISFKIYPLKMLKTVIDIDMFPII